MKLNNNKWFSLKTYVLLSFLLIFTIIFCLIWILQVVFYDSIYESIKTNEIKTLSTEIVESYTNNRVSSFIDFSYAKDCNIIVFTIVNTQIDIKFSSARESNILALNINLNRMLRQMGSDTETVFVVKNGDKKSLICGIQQAVGSEMTYFYIEGIITPLDSTHQVLTRLFVIITTIGLVFIVFMSTLLSRIIARPIEQICEKAKKLSDGDLVVSFDADDYTEVESLSKSLNYSIAEIKKSQEIQKEVIQNVSHELRTPLTMIQAYAELLLDYSGEEPQKRQQHLNTILQESKKLEMLISDMLDLSKLQSKTMRYSKEKFNLSDSLKKFDEFYNKEYSAKGYKFSFTIAENAIIFADKNRIEQAISNLINNAINYSQETQKIDVVLSLDKQNNCYKLSVIDFGSGISEEDQKYIFSRHFRSSSGKRAVAGSGIGLTIVKEILDYHKYSFGVESSIGKGSVFFINFDIEKQ